MARTHHSRFRHGTIGTVVLALAFTAFAVGTTGSGAGAAQPQIDKAAVIKLGVPMTGNGGPWFDPESSAAGSQSPSPRLWLELIYDTMIHNTPDGKGEPGLATKWTTPDLNTVELTLRQNVKFSDGTPFNAAAVKAAWDKIPNRPNQIPHMQAISSVEVVNDNTIRIHLNKPIAQQLINEDLKNPVYFAVPSPTNEATGNGETNPVGAGPYKFKSFSNGHVVLEKNPTFYAPKEQKVAGFEFFDEAAGSPQVNALQAGTVDLVLGVPAESVKTIRSQPGLTTTAIDTGTGYTISPCPTSTIFTNKSARQALQYAVDRESINQGALAGTGPPLQTMLTPRSPFYNKTLDKTYSFNPAKAKSLLKAAGIAPGTKVSAIVAAQEPYQTIAVIVKSQLQKVGLDLTLTPTTNFVSDVSSKHPDLVFASLDPSLFSLAFELPVTVLNNCGWSNPQATQALSDTADPTKTKAQLQTAWNTLQTVVHDESPVVFLTGGKFILGHKSNIHGLDVINLAPTAPQLNRAYVTK